MADAHVTVGVDDVPFGEGSVGDHELAHHPVEVRSCLSPDQPSAHLPSEADRVSGLPAPVNQVSYPLRRAKRQRLSLGSGNRANAAIRGERRDFESRAGSSTTSSTS